MGIRAASEQVVLLDFIATVLTLVKPHRCLKADV